MKFVLLHESKNDEAIRLFFNDVWELYVKVCFAPLVNRHVSAVYSSTTRIMMHGFVVDDAEPVPYGTYANPEQCVRYQGASECEEVPVEYVTYVIWATIRGMCRVIGGRGRRAGGCGGNEGRPRKARHQGEEVLPEFHIALCSVPQGSLSRFPGSFSFSSLVFTYSRLAVSRSRSLTRKYHINSKSKRL